MVSGTQAPALDRSPRVSESSLWNLGWICLAIFVAAHVPLLISHGEVLWSKPHYQFFPLVLVGSVALAWQRLQGMTSFEPGKAIIAYPLAAICIVMLTGAAILGSPWVGAITAVLATAVAIYGVGGWDLCKRLLPAWTILWLAIPIPLRGDQYLITNLQLFTAKWSSVVLDMLGVVHVMSGAVVEIPEKRLLVEEACSGIHSLFASLTCTMFLVFWTRIPIVRAIVLLIAAVFWVVVANVARVTLVTLFETQLKTIGLNLTEGLAHDILSFLVFAVILGLIFSTDRLLLFMFPRKLSRATSADDEGAALPPPPDFRKSWIGAWPVVAVYLVLVALQIIIMVPMGDEDLKIPVIGESGLPPVCANCQRRGYEDITRENDRFDEGAQSQRWTYRVGNNIAIVSLDYPFRGWHELTVCYRQNGWTETETPKLLTFGAGEGIDKQSYVEATFTKPIDEHGYLLFGVYDSQGRSVEQAYTELARKMVQGAVGLQKLRRLLGLTSQAAIDSTGPTYQVQVMVQSFTPLSEPEKAQARLLFQEAEEALRQKIKTAKGAES